MTQGRDGIFLVISGIAHSTFAFFAAGHNKLLAALVSGGPFLPVVILFLVSWRSTARSEAE